MYIREHVIAPRSKRTNIPNPEFRGAAKEVQALNDKIIVVSGSARSGKSLAIMWKLHQNALNNPGSRQLIIRKTRESLNESAIVTFEQDILGESSDLIPRGNRNARHNYKYPNGSEIVVAGMQASGRDQTARIMSSQWDTIYCQELIEFSEMEFGQLTTRLSNFKVPIQQLLADTNPDSPNHWIYRYYLKGKITFLHSFLRDNPKWWTYDNSAEGGHWSKEGASVFDSLSRLSGVQRERLLDGKWTQATGLVFPEWDDGAIDGNVTEDAEYIPEMEDVAGVSGKVDMASNVWWFLDDGYAGEYDAELDGFTANSHPRAFLLVQVRPDGKVCVFNESYKVRALPERHIKDVEEMGYGEGENFRRYAEPFRIVVDKSAVDLIGRLNEKYNATNQKITDVEESIKFMRSYVAPDENGVRKFLVHPRCKYFRSEMASCKRDDKGAVIKEFDHGVSSARYGLSVIGSIPRPNFRVLG